MEESNITPMKALNIIYTATNNLQLTRADHEIIVKCFGVLNELIPQEEETEDIVPPSNGKAKKKVLETIK